MLLSCSNHQRNASNGAPQPLERACPKAVRVHWLHPEAPHVRLPGRAVRPAEGDDVVRIIEAERVPCRVIHVLLWRRECRGSSTCSN